MKARDVLLKLAEERPLIHHLTNYVTANLVANVTRCTGALPVMAYAREEVVQMVDAASALVINIGTLDPPWVESMLLAGERANQRGIPVVLDPVGAGATAFRTRTAERLLSKLEVSVVCGNAGEIATLAGLSAEVCGVESLSADGLKASSAAARELSITVAATGSVDYVSDGYRTFAVHNGHPIMGRMVGSGCAATAVAGCFAAAGGPSLETIAESMAYFGRAGELAAYAASGPGTFEPLLLDALAELTAEPSLSGKLSVRETPEEVPH